MKPLLQLFALTALVMLAGCSEQPASTPADMALKKIRQWVNGYYNNVAQFEADMAAELPPELTHRPMHQLFVPLEAPRIDGYVVYQQSSLDGSENPAMIFRHGLLQYIPNDDGSALIQRELYFIEPEPYKNLHHNPELLADVTLDQLEWNPGCDFFLTLSDDGSTVAGPLEAGKCVLFNEGLQADMIADDRVEITATGYAFRGRYRDTNGNIVWGTASDELNRMTRQSK